MKTKDIASKYDFDQYKLEQFIEKNQIRYSKSGLGGMVVDDDDVGMIVEKYNQYRQNLSNTRWNKQMEAEKEAEAEKARAAEQSKDRLVREGYDCYYEYKAVSILDEKGHTDICKLESLMNEMGLDGWRLKAATTNELGKNVLGLGLEGLGFSVNSTVDETILYFERRILLSTRMP